MPNINLNLKLTLILRYIAVVEISKSSLNFFPKITLMAMRNAIRSEKK